MDAACRSKSKLAANGVLPIREITVGQIVAVVTGKMAMATCGVLSLAKG